MTARSMKMMQFVLAGALLALAAPLSAMQPFSKQDLKEKNLAQMEEQAKTPEDWRTLAQMYEARAEMLTEKAERHDRLEQRYASAPKSLIAKRGHGWNTPKRQAQMAEKAREEAAEAREAAAVHLARADAETHAVD